MFSQKWVHKEKKIKITFFGRVWWFNWLFLIFYPKFVRKMNFTMNATHIVNQHVLNLAFKFAPRFVFLDARAMKASWEMKKAESVWRPTNVLKNKDKIKVNCKKFFSIITTTLRIKWAMNYRELSIFIDQIFQTLQDGKIIWNYFFEACGRNEYFSLCDSHCQPTCDLPGGPSVCTKNCVAGCYCNQDLLRDEDSGRCVKPFDCPRH